MNKSTSPLQLYEAPQVFVPYTTVDLYRYAFLLLSMPVVFGIIIFGVSAMITIVSALVSALVIEIVLPRKKKLPEHSMFIALLIGASLPPQVPLFIPVTCTVLALLVDKKVIKKIDPAYVHPVALGITLAYTGFSSFMKKSFLTPFMHVPIDTVSQASTFARLQLERSQNPDVSFWGAKLTDALNTSLFDVLGVHIPDGLMDAFIGLTRGSIGETSAFLILVVSIFLIIRGLFPAWVMMSYFLGFTIPYYIFGGLTEGWGFFHGNVLVHIFSGSFLLGMFFLAADIMYSPLIRVGHIIYGSSIGFLVALFSLSHVFSWLGVAVAVLMVHFFAPSIESFSLSLRRKRRK